MHTEIWRIVLVGLFSLFFGWSLGFPFEIILCGVGLYVIWTFRTISLLFSWIDKGMRGIPPDADGVWGEISDTLNRQRRRHRRTQEKMRRTINRVSRLTEALDEGILSCAATCLWTGGIAPLPAFWGCGLRIVAALL